MTLRVAACQYPIEPVASLGAWADKQRRLLEGPAGRGARLLLLPEYAPLELTAALPAAVQGSLAAQLDAFQALVPEIAAIHGALARELGVHLLGGSVPERVTLSDGRTAYRNRARLHAPGGGCAVQEKGLMTRFEREDWGIAGGERQAVFATALGRLGVAICYDSEFPLLVRRQVEAGAATLLVPSCTDTRAGWHRVHLSCRARALENQCYVVHAVTVGAAPWSLALDQNVGAAGIYGPVDRGFTDDGIVQLGTPDQPGWVEADLDLDAIALVRQTGQVTNYDDWERPGHLTGEIAVEPLA
jgi:predicted amidohydrolase